MFEPIESKYLREEGFISKTKVVDFPSYFLDLLLEDDRFSSFVLAAKLPGEKEYRDTSRSSRIGTTAGIFTGLSWENMPVGLILFDGYSITGTMMKLGNKGFWWAHMMCFTPELHKRSYGNAVFKAKTEGFLSKKIVGVEIKGDDQKVPGLADIRNDKDLMDKIFTALKSGLIIYKDYKDDLKKNEIRFTVLRNPFRRFGGGKEEYGLIEIGLSRHLKTIQDKDVNYASLSKISFEVVSEIADHLKSMWST